MFRYHRPLVTAVIAFAPALLLARPEPASAAEIHPAMLRYPAVSATQIAFTYDNDIWVAPKAGGVAIPLSSPAGQELFPRFSPDGKRISYSASYDGNLDVYEI